MSTDFISFKDSFNSSKLYKEGILRIPQYILDQINHEIMPEIKSLCIPGTDAMVFDAARMMSTRSGWEIRPPMSRSQQLPSIFFKIKNNIKIEGRSANIYLMIVDVEHMQSLNGSFSSGSYNANTDEIILPAFGLMPNDHVGRVIEDLPLPKEVIEDLQELQILELNHLKKNSTYHKLVTATFNFRNAKDSLEHEIIHFLDPTAHKFSKRGFDAITRVGNVGLRGLHNISLQTRQYADDYAKYLDRYKKNYHRAKGLYTGKKPIEFNSMFWNIINEYDLPLDLLDQTDIIEFLKAPSKDTIPYKLKQKYTTFILAQLSAKNTRRMFLRQLATWFQENT
jgi:hypothetical protein